MSEKNERRRKILFLDHLMVLDSITNWRELNEFVQWPAVALPEGTRVVSVHEDYRRSAFGFVLEHESFEPVEDCVELPEIKVEWVTKRMALNGERNDDERD